MDFSIPRSIEGVLPRVHELIEREVIPLEPALLSGPFAQLIPALNRVRQQVKQMGLWAPHVPQRLRWARAQLRRICLCGRRARA